MKKRVYLDHGATTPVDARVLGAMKPYLLSKFGNASSLHSYGREAHEALEKSRESLAKRIGAKPSEFVFTSGGSESDNLAVKGAALAARENGSNHIITSAIEHPAVLEACNALKEAGFGLTVLNVDKEGFVRPEDVESAITKKTALVSVMHANNEIGTVEDIAAIGKICRERNVLFHTDAVQSFTKERIDVAKQSIDLASFSAHKICGPKGVGGLYVREGTELAKQVHGGPQEMDMRAGTENVAGAMGFAKAAELTTQREVAKMKMLRDRLIKKIESGIGDVKLNGPREKRLCNNANFSFRYVEGESLLLYMDMAGIAVSTGSACSAKSLQMSHVLKAIGIPPALGNGTLRFTVGNENKTAEVDYAVRELSKAVAKLRHISPLAR